MQKAFFSSLKKLYELQMFRAVKSFITHAAPVALYQGCDVEGETNIQVQNKF